jgi:hypothetical protein
MSLVSFPVLMNVTVNKCDEVWMCQSKMYSSDFFLLGHSEDLVTTAEQFQYCNWKTSSSSCLACACAEADMFPARIPIDEVSSTGSRSFYCCTVPVTGTCWSLHYSMTALGFSLFQTHNFMKQSSVLHPDLYRQDFSTRRNKPP